MAAARSEAQASAARGYLHPRPVLRRAAARRPASTSWRRRSAISPTSPSARSTRSPAPISSPARTRASPESCSTATASRRRSSPITSTAAPEAHRRLLDALGGGPLGGARLRRRHAARLRSRAQRLVADAVAAGHRVVPIPGASVGRWRRSRPPGCRRTTFCSSASCRRRRRRGGSASPRSRADRRRRSSCSNRRTASPRCSPTPRRCLAATRQAAVCRELTKLHETFDRGTLAELAARYAETRREGRDRAPHRAARRQPTPPAEADVDARCARRSQAMGVKEAAPTRRRGDRPLAPRRSISGRWR